MMSKTSAEAATPVAPEVAVNVPSGWKLVPHEPTAEMRSEGADMMWDRKGTSVDVWQAMWHAAPAPVQTEAQQSEKLSFDDAMRIAKGCTDYGGGHRCNAEHFEIYQHGIQTVINALAGAASNGLKDTQVRALHGIGSDAIAKEKAK